MTGLVRPVEGHVTLQELDGTEVRLVLKGDAEMLAFLDGHTVSVDGIRRGRALDVRTFRIEEGLHGLQIWVGVLESTINGMGLNDLNSGAFYILDDQATEIFSSHVGAPVLVEGFVDGPNHVKVMFYRALSEQEINEL